MSVSRRRVALYGLSLPLALRARSGAAEDGVDGRPSPAARFGKDSTAEDVTAGLDLTGKTVLITGCNSGIGYETLRVLVLRGAQVYGVARNMENAARACAAVKVASAKGKALPFACEQTDFSAVVACADAVQALGTPIDALICNAAVSLLPTLELARGLEKHFVVNHLSHFILVNRLLGLVKSARQGRIVMVGSGAYRAAPEAGIEFDNLSGNRHYEPWQALGQSKLANGLFARLLAQRLSDTPVTANVLHPGVVRSTRTVNANIDGLKTPQQGAATTCYVATHPALAKISGEYFEDCQVVVPGGRMRDDVLAAKLWAVSEALTGPYLLPTG